MTACTRLGATFAAIIAVLAWLALGTDFVRAMRISMADGYSLVQAFYLYIRYFTILTNLGIAVLMSMTAVGLWRGVALPPARAYAFALVYAIVVCVTYEALLRSQWSPRGLQFLTDMMMHDILPVLTLLFWIGFAPKHGMRWRDPALLLIYPAFYLVATVIGGALGQGYPYFFLDPSRIGYVQVTRVDVIFLLAFYGLGASVTALARSRADVADVLH